MKTTRSRKGSEFMKLFTMDDREADLEEFPETSSLQKHLYKTKGQWQKRAQIGDPGKYMKEQGND